jgi:hypothetical protein
MNTELQSAISQGAPLKHAETVDKSAPQIENVTVKKVDRTPFLEEVTKPHELKHAETVDKSAPAIPGTSQQRLAPLPPALLRALDLYRAPTLFVRWFLCGATRHL